MSGKNRRKLEVHSADMALSRTCLIALLQVVGRTISHETYESWLNPAAGSFTLDLYVKPDTSIVRLGRYKLVVTHARYSHAVIRQVVLVDTELEIWTNKLTFGSPDNRTNLFWEIHHYNDDNLDYIHEALLELLEKSVARYAWKDIKKIPQMSKVESGKIFLTYTFDNHRDSQHPVLSAEVECMHDEEMCLIMPIKLTLVTTIGIKEISL